jgi:D-amino peptidase
LGWVDLVKAFISVDLEGMPYIVIPGHLNLKGSMYSEARKITTEVTLTVVEELHKGGFDEIVVADSHGPMVNVLVEDIPEYVQIIRGYPRPISMVSGVEGCDAAVFLGYHAKYGTAKSTFDHTYSGGIISKLELNGIEASEFLLNAYAAGERGVSVVLVAGEAQLMRDVEKVAPWVETLALKESLSRVSAKSYGMPRIKKDLKKATAEAVSNFLQKKTKPLKIKKPVKVKITFQAAHFADLAQMLPSVNRLDGLNVEYTSQNVTEAYRTFELLVLAANGVCALLADLT